VDRPALQLAERRLPLSLRGPALSYQKLLRADDECRLVAQREENADAVGSLLVARVAHASTTPRPRGRCTIQPADRALADLVDVDVPHVLEPLAVVVDAVEGPLTDDAIAVDGPLAERLARALVARFEEREKRRRGVRPPQTALPGP